MTVKQSEAASIANVLMRDIGSYAAASAYAKSIAGRCKRNGEDELAALYETAADIIRQRMRRKERR